MFSKSLQWILGTAVAAILFATGYLVGINQSRADISNAFASGVAKGAGALETLWGEEGDVVDEDAVTESINLLVGTLTAIASNQLQVQTDTSTKPITVVIADATQFFIRNQKDAAQVSREQSAYQAAVNKNPQLNAAPPATFTEESISADALKVGDSVEIFTSSDQASDAILADRITRISPAPTAAQ